MICPIISCVLSVVAYVVIRLCWEHCPRACGMAASSLGPVFPSVCAQGLMFRASGVQSVVGNGEEEEVKPEP